jgi:hypothetical protein
VLTCALWHYGVVVYHILCCHSGSGPGLFRVNACELDIGTGQQLRCCSKIGLGAGCFSARVGPIRLEKHVYGSNSPERVRIKELLGHLRAKQKDADLDRRTRGGDSLGETSGDVVNPKVSTEKAETGYCACRRAWDSTSWNTLHHSILF